MKKFVFISSIASPHQVKFCYALRKYFDARFWFYASGDTDRASWWKIDLGDKCEILSNVMFRNSGRYLCLGLWQKLNSFSPDIVMLGGFSIPGNYLGYLWAVRNRRKIVVFTERSRDKNGNMRKRSVIWRLIRMAYSRVDIVMTSAEDIVPQFRDELGFGNKVLAGRYAADLDAYFSHSLRSKKIAYTYLFANRLTKIYNPLGAIEIFSEIANKYPGSRLLMNAAGELLPQCKTEIEKLRLVESVEFLTCIKSWDELNKVYARSDILLLPAFFSNGNFTILEAMASGMCVIVSDEVSGIGKLIEDGRNGFRCKPVKEEFVERINKCVDNPELLINFAQINRQIASPFSMSGTAEFFKNIFGVS